MDTVATMSRRRPRHDLTSNIVAATAGVAIGALGFAGFSGAQYAAAHHSATTSESAQLQQAIARAKANIARDQQVLAPSPSSARNASGATSPSANGSGVGGGSSAATTPSVHNSSGWGSGQASNAGSAAPSATTPTPVVTPPTTVVTQPPVTTPPVTTPRTGGS